MLCFIHSFSYLTAECRLLSEDLEVAEVLLEVPLTAVSVTSPPPLTAPLVVFLLMRCRSGVYSYEYKNAVTVCLTNLVKKKANMVTLKHTKDIAEWLARLIYTAEAAVLSAKLIPGLW
ncbi:hypothetical protein E2C01_074103 [Portunus trituberculatus]|uniref:Uncharacterized protein n=1 Tax=Portunus trituberculatus TaxID=210409 RepID=A0A5B7I2I6_PORTR|nr:hypothetical protein [Portunus trituberculatus]